MAAMTSAPVSVNARAPTAGATLFATSLAPMFMAMQAAAFELTGNWRIAFLLPSLLAALGTLWLIYDFGRRQWNHRVGLWAALAVLAGLTLAGAASANDA